MFLICRSNHIRSYQIRDNLVILWETKLLTFQWKDKNLFDLVFLGLGLISNHHVQAELLAKIKRTKEQRHIHEKK